MNAIGVILLLTPASLPANASLLWDWSYAGTGISASGTFLTANRPDAQGGYLITAIAGTRNGENITGLQPTGTAIPGNEPYAVDNLVFPGPGPQLTSHGFGFSLANGTYSNPFYADFLPTPGYLEFYSMPNSNSSTELPIVFSAALVASPEPSTFLLCVAASGFGMFALRLRRRSGSAFTKRFERIDSAGPARG